MRVLAIITDLSTPRSCTHAASLVYQYRHQGDCHGGVDPERVYVIGSRARGQATPDCDYDFIVFAPHSEKPR